MPSRAEGLASQTCRISSRLICMYFTTVFVNMWHRITTNPLRSGRNVKIWDPYVGHDLLSHRFSSEQNQALLLLEFKVPRPRLHHKPQIYGSEHKRASKIVRCTKKYVFHDSSMDIVGKLFPNHTVSTPASSMRQFIALRLWKGIWKMLQHCKAHYLQACVCVNWTGAITLRP
jgi:hypothetical protein